MSAVTGEGVSVLLDTLAARLRSLAPIVELLVPYERGDVVAALHREGEVLVEVHAEGGSRLRARLPAPGRHSLRRVRRQPARRDRRAPPRSRPTSCWMHSRSRSWCSTSTARSLFANQRARDDFAVLGEPLEYDGELFTHRVRARRRARPAAGARRHPVGAHAAHGRDAQRLRDGRALERLPGHGVAHRRHPAAPRRRRRDHRRDLHVLRHHRQQRRAQARVARVGGAVPAHRRERGRRRVPLHGRATRRASTT